MMSTLPSSLSSRLSILLSLLLLSTIMVSSVSAAVGCSGTSCSGKNPQTMGCSADAVTKGNVFSQGILTVEMRYSKACKAWWARVTCDGPDPFNAVYLSFMQFANGVQTSRARLAGDYAAGCYSGETTWTYMIPDRSSGDHYNACWQWGTWTAEEAPTEADYCLGRY